MTRLLACFFCLFFSVVVVHASLATDLPGGPQTGIVNIQPQNKLPSVIIYTLSTCPHCKAAKEYFTKNNIPYINREVDSDSKHMDELMQIYETMKVPYEKRGVPLILIGDSIKLQGFKEEKVQEAIKKVLQK